MDITLGSLFDGIGGFKTKQFSSEHKKHLSESAKARCTSEWRKNQSIQRSAQIDTNIVKNMYDNGASQQEIATALNVSQKVIWRHMKNNGIKSRTTAKRNQCGDNNSYWKGGRIVKDGYVMIKYPTHPRAKQCGDYVYEHILVMEAYLGRFLKWYGADDPETEIVHHKNCKKYDNCPDNLLLCTFKEHMKIHNAIRKGGDAICHTNTN